MRKYSIQMQYALCNTIISFYFESSVHLVKSKIAKHRCLGCEGLPWEANIYLGKPVTVVEESGDYTEGTVQILSFAAYLRN